MRKSALLFAALVFGSPALAATLESLNKEQVVNTFVNKTAVSIPTDIFNGQLKPNTFSMYLDDKGNVSGKLSAKPKDGLQTDTGTYSIDTDGTIYAVWNHWYDGKKVCFHFFNTDNAYLSIDCNNVFHTVYLKNAIKTGKQLD